MKKHAVSTFLVVSCMFVVGGCAKHEMVKADEPLTATSTVVRQPVNPNSGIKQAPVKAEVIGEQSVMQALLKKSDAQETLEPIPQAGELTASLEEIYFDFDAYVLSREARDSLVKNAGLMKNDRDAKVRIEGHCDERGSDEYNLALGEKRARAAMQYLMTMGIPEERLSVISFGREKPADHGHDEAAWAKNRRDEFIITTK